jgi:hypothetical protein
MSKTLLRIGNAHAFWGDNPLAPQLLLQQQPNLDYLTLDYLAEVSLSIMAIQRSKDPLLGYARDFVETLETLLPFWKRGLRFKIVTNAGGLNPIECAKACMAKLQAAQCEQIRIGIVSGDDILSLMRIDPHSKLYAHLETAAPLAPILPSLVTANAYLGASSIAQALQAGVDIVITGRVTDPSLTVGPCMAHFGWQWDDFNRIASATVAGHLLECGTQACGGMSTKWIELSNPFHMGFPYIEMSENGEFVITKPENTGGKVSIETIKEQLLYEIEDPNNYLSPDATVSFLSLELQNVGENRILVKGASGKPPPSTYKVSASYKEGYRCEGMLTIFGENAIKRANLCAETLRQCLLQTGNEPQRWHVETIGNGAVVPGVIEDNFPLRECVLRIAIADSRKEVLELFSKSLASLITSGPQGVTGYIGGRPSIRPVYAFWPCLIEKNALQPIVEFIPPLYK